MGGMARKESRKANRIARGITIRMYGEKSSITVYRGTKVGKCFFDLGLESWVSSSVNVFGNFRSNGVSNYRRGIFPYF